jgi:soluble lytic murein transglycosylase-like protein
MRNIITIAGLLFLVLFLGSSQPYEHRIELPCDGVIFRYREPERTLIPPRRDVPEEYRNLFNVASISAGIPPGVLESIAFVESGFYSQAISPPGAEGRRDLGMFQFNSKYMRWYSDTYNEGKDFDPMDPEEAVIIAAKHIRYLHDYYGHWPTVCLAYNAGIAAVDNDLVPDSSYRYLIKIYEKE